MEYKNIKELLDTARVAEGHAFKEYDIHNRLDNAKNKGALGQLIEEGLFGYEVNSRSEADFANLGVELKVVPLKFIGNNQISAKERIVLTIIDYMEEYKKTFYESDCWKKSEKLLIMFYLWDKALAKGDYKIIKTVLHSFPEKDLMIIVRDWETIINKIKQGKAHEISEGDTMYLGACTKGANHNSVRKQPFSDIPAKQRAYSLKSSYVTNYARELLHPNQVESIASSEELKNLSITEVLVKKFNPYVGKTIDEIAEILGLDINLQYKSKVAGITSKILGINGTKLDEIDEFAKANIKFKTIRLEPNGKPKESMSFEQINFHKLLTQDWEESQLYETFEYTKFLFVVFEYKEKLVSPNKKKKIVGNKETRKLYFKKIVLWNMPESVIQNELKKLWRDTRNVLKKGIILTPSGRGVSNNLPGQKDNPVCHIRPKAQNAADKVELPDGTKITKQTYWLNNDYIAKIINEDEMSY